MVLGCYANAGRMAERGIRVICLDEMMPNEKELDRCPICRPIPGSIEQRAFKYTRHVTVTIETVTILTFLKSIAHMMASWPE
jgi:hypothetical protein